MIIKLNETAMFAMGFDRAGVEYLRHLLRQIGDVVGAATLPQVAGEIDSIAVDAAFGGQPELAELAKQVEELQAKVDEAPARIAELAKQVEELRQALVFPPPAAPPAGAVYDAVFS